MSFLPPLFQSLRAIFNKPGEKLFYHLVGLIPRDKTLWIFGAQKGAFYCNPKYLFLHLSLHPQVGVTPVWLTRNKKLATELQNKGLNAKYLLSPSGIWTAIRGSHYFINCSLQDISFNLSKGATVLNLWHGIPLKKIQLDNQRNSKNAKKLSNQQQVSLFNRLFNPKDMRKFDYILSTSDYVTDYAFASAFNIEKERCLAFGYPRTDLFFAPHSTLENLIETYEELVTKNTLAYFKKFDKVFVFMPTWRDTENDFIQSSGIDFDHLEKQLEEKNACLVLKLHPFTRINLDTFDGYKNILVIDRKVDIYPLLPFTDALITDYSSIYFDYLLLSKPIIFFCPDYEAYLANCRDLYLDYDENTPGPKAKDYPALIEHLFDPALQTQYSNVINEAKKRFWGNYSGRAAENITEFFLKCTAEKGKGH